MQGTPSSLNSLEIQREINSLEVMALCARQRGNGSSLIIGKENGSSTIALGLPMT